MFLAFALAGCAAGSGKVISTGDRYVASAAADNDYTLDAGDKIGARMAFLSAYDRLLQVARDTLRPCEWAVSIGWDGDRRAFPRARRGRFA